VFLAQEHEVAEWVPLLSDSDETTALASEAVDSIAQSLINHDYVIGKEASYHYRPYEDALLYAYLALARDDIHWAHRAAECLNSAIDRADEETGYLGLFGGLAGLGWTLEHISKLFRHLSSSNDATDSPAANPVAIFTEDDEDDLLADVDALILRELRRDDPSRCYDLISGLVGFGTYFMERWPKKTAVQGIAAIFDQLELLAEVTDVGITWRSNPDLLPDSDKVKCPDGCYNLGVAHGIPAIIYFLSTASHPDIVNIDRANRLLEGAMSWLIAHQLPHTARSRFSPWIIRGQEPIEGRLAWCYGDLGIAAVLLQVARRSGRTDWQEFAHALLDHCLAWPSQVSGVHDAPLCHGATGVAHIFNRIYQGDHDARCRDAALEWYKRALVMRRHGNGIGGFASLTVPEPAQSIVWEANPGFVDGAIGIALALIAAITPIEPRWDQSMLLSAITTV
jgi:hypothetical protein